MAAEAESYESSPAFQTDIRGNQRCHPGGTQIEPVRSARAARGRAVTAMHARQHEFPPERLVRALKALVRELSMHDSTEARQLIYTDRVSPGRSRATTSWPSADYASCASLCRWRRRLHGRSSSNAPRNELVRVHARRVIVRDRHHHHLFGTVLARHRLEPASHARRVAHDRATAHWQCVRRRIASEKLERLLHCGDRDRAIPHAAA